MGQIPSVEFDFDQIYDVENKSMYKQIGWNTTGDPNEVQEFAPLTKSFVEMHKGRIWANTEVEKGAEIIFALPIKNVSKVHKPQIKSLDARIEKCNIELSDIYSLTR